MKLVNKHFWVLLVAAIVGIAAMVLFDQMWLFWVLAVWASAFVVHLLIAKSLHVEEEWADDRAADANYKAYDLDHISAIRKDIARRNEAGRSKE